MISAMAAGPICSREGSPLLDEDQYRLNRMTVAVLVCNSSAVPQFAKLLPDSSLGDNIGEVRHEGRDDAELARRKDPYECLSGSMPVSLSSFSATPEAPRLRAPVIK